MKLRIDICTQTTYYQKVSFIGHLNGTKTLKDRASIAIAISNVAEINIEVQDFAG